MGELVRIHSELLVHATQPKKKLPVKDELAASKSLLTTHDPPKVPSDPDEYLSNGMSFGKDLSTPGQRILRQQQLAALFNL